MAKLSIVIPAYNEENTIGELLRQVQSVDTGNTEKEIIVVDDGSTDSTNKVVASFGGVTLIRQLKNLGKGFAVRTGIDAATGDIILIQDADLEYDPMDYPALIEPILSDSCDVVYGSRRLRKQARRYSRWTFYAGGVILTTVTNLLFPSAKITDEPTCYKVFRRSFLDRITLTCMGFEFCPEVTAKVLRLNRRIVEVPIQYTPRSAAEGKKIKWRDGIIHVWILIKYRITPRSRFFRDT